MVAAAVVMILMGDVTIVTTLMGDSDILVVFLVCDHLELVISFNLAFLVAGQMSPLPVIGEKDMAY